MFDHTHTPLPRALAGAAMLITAAFARPAVAQTAIRDHALLNQVPSVAYVPTGARAISNAPADPSVGSGITGEQALQGRAAPRRGSAESEPRAVPTPDRKPPIDGEAALRGRPPRVAGTR